MSQFLYSEIREVAIKTGLDIDREIYSRFDKDPLEPIAFAGNPRAQVAFLGRDLGRQEVEYGEPLIGDAGRRVRRAVLESYEPEAISVADNLYRAALKHAFLTNTVPYKPTGNKAYPDDIREQFRPCVERILLDEWRGDHLIALGTEAFLWFTPYVGVEAIKSHWASDERYTSPITLKITSSLNPELTRTIQVQPLPHPSPLNVSYFKLFPDLIRRALMACASSTS